MTPRQEAFVREYLIDLNATQAAIRAGYTPKGADVTGSKMLGNPKVADAIKEAQSKRAERTEITADRVLREYARIAFYNPGRVLRVNRDGLPVVDFSEATEEDYRVLAEVSTEQGASRFDDEGNPTVSVFKAKVKHHNKLSALDALAKHLGMMTEKLDVTSAGKPLGEMSPDEIERKAREILARRTGDT